MISEELISINSALRRLTAGKRVGRGAVNDSDSIDRQQFREWEKTTWSDIEAAQFTWADIEATTSQLRSIVSGAEELLSPTKLRYFNEWSHGKTTGQIAEKYGVNQSTVYRSVREKKKPLKT